MRLIKYFLLFSVALALLLQTSCVTENFTDPFDPFETQILGSNPYEFTLGSGDKALKFKTNPENVTKYPEGIRIKGSLFVENNAYGDMRVSNGDFLLMKKAPAASRIITEHGLLPVTKGNFKSLNKNNSSDTFEAFTGYGAFVPPNDGAFRGIQIPFPDGNAVGFVLGSEISDKYPVAEDKWYFYLEIGVGYSMTLHGPKANNVGAIVLDPSDPLLYFEANFENMKYVNYAGFGLSAQGNIPYKPKVDIYKIPEFNGNLYLKAGITIDPYPFQIQGEAVMGFNPDEKYGVVNFLKGNITEYKLGLNGTLVLNHEIIDFLGLTIELGNASACLSIKGNGDTELNFAGLVKNPPLSPVQLLAQLLNMGDGKNPFEFLNFLEINTQEKFIYGTFSLPGNLKSWDSHLAKWEFGYKCISNLNLFGYKLPLNETLFEFNTEHINMYAKWRPPGFDFLGDDFKINPEALTDFNFIHGEIKFNSDFLFEGRFKYPVFVFGGGPLRLELGMILGAIIEKANKDFNITGDIEIYGKARVFGIKAGFTIRATVTIGTSGFNIRFRIGVGKLGFDVTIPISDKLSMSAVNPMIVTEIPLEIVPIGNRFNENFPVPTNPYYNIR